MTTANLKIPYRLKSKRLCDLPISLQIALKEKVIDFYSDRYDCDSNEIRAVLENLNDMTVEEIEKEIR